MSVRQLVLSYWDCTIERWYLGVCILITRVGWCVWSPEYLCLSIFLITCHHHHHHHYHYHYRNLLSVQRISTIGQIIKWLCVSVSEWVSEWVSHCHTKRVECSTDRSLPPKLATQGESQEMWLPTVLVEIRNISVRQTGSGINTHHCSYEKYL